MIINPYVFAAAAPGTVTYVGAGSRNPGSASLLPVLDAPAGVANGDLMVACMASRVQTNFTIPAGWTAIGSEVDQADTSANAGNGVTLRMCYRVYQTGDPATWTGASSVNVFYSTSVLAVRGQHASSPIDASTIVGGNGPGTSVSIAGVTASTANSMLLCFATVIGTSFTMPATSRVNRGTAAGGLSTQGASSEPVNAGATGTRSVTSLAGSTATPGWATAAIIIKPT